MAVGVKGREIGLCVHACSRMCENGSVCMCEHARMYVYLCTRERWKQGITPSVLEAQIHFGN